MTFFEILNVTFQSLFLDFDLVHVRMVFLANTFLFYSLKYPHLFSKIIRLFPKTRYFNVLRYSQDQKRNLFPKLVSTPCDKCIGSRSSMTAAAFVRNSVPYAGSCLYTRVDKRKLGTGRID